MSELRSAKELRALREAKAEVARLTKILEDITEGIRFSCDCGKYATIRYDGLCWFPSGHGEDMGECAVRGGKS